MKKTISLILSFTILISVFAVNAGISVSAASNKVTEVKLIDASRRYIAIEWAHIMKPKILYQVRCKDPKGKTVYQMYKPSIQANIYPLEPNTTYTIQVRACDRANKKPKGPWSKTLIAKTKTKQHIHYMDIQSRSHNSILVSYQVPENATHITIMWAAKGIVTTKEIKTNNVPQWYNAYYLITGLKSLTKYEIQIKAKVDGSYGEWTKAKSESTTKGNTTPTTVTGIKATSRSSKKTNLKWNKASNATYYLVAYQYTDKNGKLSMHYRQSSKNRITLDGLKPNTTYSIQVLSFASNEKYCASNWSKALKVKIKK